MVRSGCHPRGFSDCKLFLVALNDACPTDFRWYGHDGNTGSITFALQVIQRIQRHSRCPKRALNNEVITVFGCLPDGLFRDIPGKVCRIAGSISTMPGVQPLCIRVVATEIVTVDNHHVAAGATLQNLRQAIFTRAWLPAQHIGKRHAG